ncbi:MAG: VTT domain-containing protein [Rhizomicrobium sp.]
MAAMTLGVLSAKAAALFFMTFVSEDAAMLGGAAMTAANLLATPLVFAACFLGIWLGDMALYALARRFGRPLLARPWVKRRIDDEQIAKSEAWLKRRGPMVLLAVRFVPGLRLPTYLLAGILAMPFSSFALATGAIAFVWVGLILGLAKLLGAAAASHWATPIWEPVFRLLRLNPQAQAGFLAAAILLALFVLIRRRQAFAELLSRPKVQRWLQWEFWPARLFYLPIGVNYLWLGLKYGGFNLPSVANPGMYTGGLIGESKFATLEQLRITAPDFTARSGLIREKDSQARLRRFEQLLGALDLKLPLVLKPDVAQRGSGFRLVRAWDEAKDYLLRVSADVVVQDYVPGPCEAGIFYYRFPDEERGRIFAITEKLFPTIQGDGRRNVEELILADPRAAIVAKTYLARHQAIRGKILATGESLKLVEAGNHCQGCIFRDGQHLWSEALEARIEEISRTVPGFFIGRYDVRYPCEADFKKGENFRIVELNGAASEATSIYDSRNSLFRAYAILFRQWDLVFAIGAANRALGHRPAPLALLRSEWRKYQARSVCHPLAD